MAWHTGLRVAVGSGIFGTTAALYLARAVFDALPFEQRRNLLQDGSNAQQRRLHRGYHYPQSPATARACIKGVHILGAEYPEATVSPHRHYVVVAKHDSLVSGDQCLRYFDRWVAPEGKPAHDVNPMADAPHGSAV